MEFASPPASAVTIDDPFWSPRRRTNVEVTLDHQYDQMIETGRIDNLRKAAGEIDGEFVGRYYNDSDIYKWIEAVSYVLATEDDPDLETKLDSVIDSVAAAQNDDGYLNSYFSLVEPDSRWTNLGMMHELYSAGHLFEAAVAHHRMSGDDRLLDVARRFADHIDEVFGPDAKRGYPGHEEIELALVKLYRVTDEPRYLELATYFVDERGTPPSRFAWELDHPEAIAGPNFEAYERLFLDEDGEYDGRYAQDHAPALEQPRADGHAVRAMYLFSGMADVGRETGEERYFEALESLWETTVGRRTYVTGGIGSSAHNEGFTEDFDLPNGTAYAETCAAVGNIFWNQRLLEHSGEAYYADVIERVLYNGFLAGVSLEGNRFFYENPLASDGDHHRKEWFDCACCPPNAARLLASLDRYCYLVDSDASTVAITQFISSTLDGATADLPATIEVETEYPWAGEVAIHVEPEAETAALDLRIRVPPWAPEPTASLNDERVPLDIGDDGFASLDREWESDDELRVEFDLPIERVHAHPAIESTRGKLALRRGPIVYCIEEIDVDAPPSVLGIPPDAHIEAIHEPGLLDGITVLRGSGMAPDPDAWDSAPEPYRTRSPDPRPVEFQAVPYYAWDHRDPGEMRVWIWETP